MVGVAVSPTIDIPQPTSGPSARLQLSDPSTQYLVFAVVAAVGAITALFADAKSPAAQLAAVTAVAHLIGTVLAVIPSKHSLAASLASVAPTVDSALTLADQSPSAHQALTEARAAVDSLAAAIEAASNGVSTLA
jgi:hypothetical protein